MPIVDTKDMSIEEIKALYEAEALAHDKDTEENNKTIEGLNKSLSDKETEFNKEKEALNKTIATLRIDALKAPTGENKEEEEPKDEDEESSKIESIKDVVSFMQNRKNKKK